MKHICLLLIIPFFCACASKPAKPRDPANVSKEPIIVKPITAPNLIYDIVKSSRGTASGAYADHAMIYGTPTIKKLNLKLSPAWATANPGEYCIVEMEMYPGQDGKLQKPLYAKFHTSVLEAPSTCADWMASHKL